MKNITFLKKTIIINVIFFLVYTTFSLKAQDNVGVGTTTPAPSALLDIDATLGGNTKGLLIPRLTDVQMYAIPNPANSLLIYNTDSMCYYFYRQLPNTWVSMCTRNPGNSQDTMYINYALIDSLFTSYLSTDSLFAHYANTDSLFAHYISTDSLFTHYANIDSLFAHYISTDSLFANYANIDSLFAHYISTDSLFANYANIDSLFAHYISTDSLFANYANIDSLFAHYISTDSLFAHYASIDSLFANYISTDSLFAHFISTDSIFAHYGSFDSLIINGVSIQSLIDSALNNSDSICSNATTNYVTKFTSPTSTCNSIIYDNGTNIGIGTSSPIYKLHTIGDIYANGGWMRISGNLGLYFESWGGGWFMQDGTWIRSFNSKGLWTNTGLIGSNGGLTIGYGGTAPPGGGAIFAGAVAIGFNSPSVKLSVNGNVHANLFVTTSDERLKQNILSLPFSGLDIINQLRPVTYNWKKIIDRGMEGTQIGFIAQELEKILPSIVVTFNDSSESKAVKFNELLPIIVKAMQEQQKIISDQKNAINDLQLNNQALKTEVSSLKTDYDTRLKALETLMGPKGQNTGRAISGKTK